MSVLIAICFTNLAGCHREKPPGPTASATSSPPTTRASVALRVLVVNEPGLVEPINRLRGEWAERTGGKLTAIPVSWSTVAQSKLLDADLIIFPSRYLGDLCVRGLLRPVRQNVLDDESMKFDDIFPLVRNELISWGGQIMALPLGIGPFALTPTSDAPRAIALLSAAAPHAISNARIGVLFDTETMKPRITEPEFVKALVQLAERNGSKVGKQAASSTDELVIPVLGYNDRLIAVTSSSHNAASAFKLLEWLAQPEMISQFAQVDGLLLPPRRSLESSAAWYDKSLSATERTQRGKLLDAALSGQRCLLIPRIPGIDEYLAALDAAVKAVVVDKTSPAAALKKAAQRWQQITDSHGREKQREAYYQHLGISEE